MIDQNGVVLPCPQCGQRNRIAFRRLDQPARCGKCKTEIPGLDTPLELDSVEHFDALIGQSALPVLVDFWAEWCGPCKIVAPEFEKVAANSVREFLVAKVNTEDFPSLASRYTIQAIPTLIVFQQGREVARKSGAIPAAAIRSFVQDSLHHAHAHAHAHA